MGTVEIRVTVSETEHERLKDAKGDRTWYEVIRDGAKAGVQTNE